MINIILQTKKNDNTDRISINSKLIDLMSEFYHIKNLMMNIPSNHHQISGTMNIIDITIDCWDNILRVLRNHGVIDYRGE